MKLKLIEVFEILIEHNQMYRSYKCWTQDKDKSLISVGTTYEHAFVCVCLCLFPLWFDE